MGREREVWILTDPLDQRSPTFLAPGTAFVEDNFPTDLGVGCGDGSGGNASDGDRWGAADEASLACPLLTSCCAARFLIGLGRGPGVGDPCVRRWEDPGEGRGPVAQPPRFSQVPTSGYSPPSS